ADPNVKGNTVSGGSKSAVLETGLTIQVPMFINEGDKVIVSTSDGKYVSRVN
ncbi:MAG: elongation factor P, partial [Amphibacillus sp.]|nr:elongation factor P [Amphibacillus sp.]